MQPLISYCSSTMSPGDKLRQERIRAAAMRAPALRQRPAVGRRPADRTTAVPAEPLRLGHHRVGHQRFERILRGHPGDLHQAAAEAAGRRHRPRHRRRCDPAARCRRCRPTMLSESSSKCGRKIACVAIGRSVARSPCRDRRSWPVACRGRLRRSLCASAISPYTSRLVAPEPDRAPSTTCGTTCSTCRRGGSAPACR